MKQLAVLLALIGMGFQAWGQVLSIASIQGNAESSPFVDSTVTILAFVTEPHGDHWYMQDAYGPWNGIRVIGPDVLVPSNPPWWSGERQPEVGDQLEISGTIVENDGNTELHDAVLVNFVNFWMATPAAITVTSLTLQDEQYEGTRIRLEQATVLSAPDANGIWTVTDGVEEMTCIGIDVDDPMGNEDPDGPSPGDVYQITGASLESNGNHMIHVGDIDVISLETDQEFGVDRLSLFPNPAQDFVKIQSTFPAGTPWRAMDSRGRELASGEVQHTAEWLNISDWPAGAIHVVVGTHQWLLLKQD
ncbi:MAG: hypothetical protein ACPGYK_04280 [Flavobacteriales bacterium]